MSDSHILLNNLAVERTVSRLAHEIAERNLGGSNVVLLGIQQGGVILARRIGRILEQIWRHAVPVGSLDVSLHRDDLNTRAAPVIFPTTIPGDVEGKTVVLVDDVLFSGRTIRAALDALNDFGRPQSIQLAVLIDRGHRQLPIKADFVGKEVDTELDERVEVKVSELGADDCVWIESAAARNGKAGAA